MTRVYLHSLGCRLNQSEVEEMARQFSTTCHLVDEPVQADVCVVNTCAVTAQAERKTRHLLRALRRANPAARIAAVGCAATLHPEALRRIAGVAWVVSNEHKEGVVEMVTGVPLSESAGPALQCGSGRHTRALVKVQDGCDNRCTYCVVRLLRGRARSKPLEQVVAEVRALVDAGYQEAVLSGVNLGAYGQDLGLRDGLAYLLRAILSETALPRLRLSSVEPWDLDERVLELWADARLCRQLHLPLQAGCDATLERMGRRSTVAGYAALAGAARVAIPDLALTTDVIVGFPGEDEAAFAESLALVQELGLARLHVFSFSPRPGTAAADMPDAVPFAVREERALRMRELGQRLAADFRQRYVGREMAVLWERRHTDGRWHGLTDNFLRVALHDAGELHNRITITRLLTVQDGLLMGELDE